VPLKNRTPHIQSIPWPPGLASYGYSLRIHHAFEGPRLGDAIAEKYLVCDKYIESQINLAAKGLSYFDNKGKGILRDFRKDNIQVEIAVFSSRAARPRPEHDEARAGELGLYAADTSKHGCIHYDPHFVFAPGSAGLSRGPQASQVERRRAARRVMIATDGFRIMGYSGV
jgi:hypothetical protein